MQTGSASLQRRRHFLRVTNVLAQTKQQSCWGCIGHELTPLPGVAWLVKNSGDLGSIPGLGRSPGEGKGYPLQYSGLENSMGSQRVGHD